MDRGLGAAAALILTLIIGAGADAQVVAAATKGPTMPAPLVFFDIAAPNLENQATFYRDIFGWQIAADGRLRVPVTSPLPGSLRVEAPQQGPVTERVLYIGVPDITATLARIGVAGGSTVFPRMEVPGVVVIALFKDPAGNRMGLVEMNGNTPKIPKAK
jgi:predicted enzyme related to lactoylglutathione lyase